MQIKYVHIKIIVLQSFLISQLSIGGDTELKHGESKNNYNFSEVFLNVNMSNLDASFLGKNYYLKT